MTSVRFLFRVRSEMGLVVSGLDKWLFAKLKRKVLKLLTVADQRSESLTSQAYTLTFACNLKWSMRFDRFWNFLLHTLQQCFRLGSSSPELLILLVEGLRGSAAFVGLFLGFRMPAKKDTASFPPAPATFTSSKAGFLSSWLLSSSSSMVSYSKNSSSSAFS